jgi:hypothetical protein
MSHHYSGPDFSFPHGDPRLDLCELFAFPKPGDASKSIVIMDVHPSAGVNPPGSTTTEPFAPEAIYELKIDTNGDARADIAYRFRFSPADSGNGSMTATVRRVEGADAEGTGDGGKVVIEGAPVSTGREAKVTEAGDYRFFAGWRSDPFFFDAGGALNNFQFTGDDFFADKDVCSIAMELPNSTLGFSGSGRLGLWHRTLIPADGGSAGWLQVDRGARAQVSTILCPNELKPAYLQGEPADDARFLDSFAHVLEHVGGYGPDEAKRVAGTLLPDILHYDPTRSVEYPDNGRGLTDDAADVFFTVFTNGKVTGDDVSAHTDFLSDFPYVGPPHNAYSA